MEARLRMRNPWIQVHPPACSLPLCPPRPPAPSFLRRFSVLSVAVWLLALAPWPASARDTPLLLVLQKKANALGLYDPQSGAHFWNVEVGTKPHEMALSEGDRLAFVTDYGVDTYTDTAEGGRTVSIVDIAAAKRVGTIDLGRFRRPHGIVAAYSSRLYVTVDHPAAVLEIDQVRRQVAAEYLLDQQLPHMVAVSKDERYLYTANAGSGTVSIIDRRARITAANVQVGGVPMGLALSRDGSRLYVATRDANRVAVVDTQNRTVTRQIAVAGGPARVRLTPNDELLLVTLIGSGELAVVATADDREVARFKVGAAAEGVTIDTRTGFGYASAQGANRVVKFSLTDWRPVLDIATDASPDPVEVVQVRQP
jgi:YVTN family beta-propeller protein